MLLSVDGNTWLINIFFKNMLGEKESWAAINKKTNIIQVVI